MRLCGGLASRQPERWQLGSQPTGGGVSFLPEEWDFWGWGGAQPIGWGGSYGLSRLRSKRAAYSHFGGSTRQPLRSRSFCARRNSAALGARWRGAYGDTPSQARTSLTVARESFSLLNPQIDFSFSHPGKATEPRHIVISSAAKDMHAARLSNPLLSRSERVDSFSPCHHCGSGGYSSARNFKRSLRSSVASIPRARSALTPSAAPTALRVSPVSRSLLASSYRFQSRIQFPGFLTPTNPAMHRPDLGHFEEGELSFWRASSASSHS